MRLLHISQIRTVGSRWLPVAKVFSRATPQLVLGISSREMKLPLEKPKPRGITSGLSGAATRIRTGDLILTKDVLYQLSHSSMPSRIFPRDAVYYTKKIGLCQ